jgi:hypothetical protein
VVSIRCRLIYADKSDSLTLHSVFMPKGNGKLSMQTTQEPRSVENHQDANPLNAKLNPLARVIAAASLAASLVHANTAEADIVYDFTDLTTLKAGFNETTPNQSSALVQSIAIAPIMVPGPFRLDRVELIFGKQDLFGNANAGDLSEVSGWRLKAFDSLADLQADPFGVSSGSTVEFSIPTNAHWQDIIGTVDGFELRRAQFNVTSPIILSGDAFISVFPILTNPFTLFGLPQSTGVGGIGAPTWVATENGGGFVGPQMDVGAAFPYSAMRVDITAVPEPSSGLLVLAMGTLAAGWLTRRRLTESAKDS